MWLRLGLWLDRLGFDRLRLNRLRLYRLRLNRLRLYRFRFNGIWVWDDWIRFIRLNRFNWLRLIWFGSLRIDFKCAKLDRKTE